MYTTLNRIRKQKPCRGGWEKLLKYLGKTKTDNEPLPLLTILDSNGLDDTLWCFRAVDGFEKEKLLLSVTYAREVEHLMPAESKKALDVFERYANGLATEDEFEAACGEARAAVYTADVARAAVYTADAAAHASWAAADAAAHASWAASWAASLAAYDADARAAPPHAYSTIKAKQETQLIQLLKDSAKGKS